MAGGTAGGAVGVGGAAAAERAGCEDGSVTGDGIFAMKS